MPLGAAFDLVTCGCCDPAGCTPADVEVLPPFGAFGRFGGAAPPLEVFGDAPFDSELATPDGGDLVAESPLPGWVLVKLPVRGALPVVPVGPVPGEDRGPGAMGLLP